MAEPDSKTSDRILFRVNETLYNSISTFAKLESRSVNGEICSAVSKWLYERELLSTIKDNLGASAPNVAVREILSASTQWHKAQAVEVDKIKTNVRFQESVNTDLRAAWACQKLLFGPVSFNAFIKQIVAWWVSYRFEIKALGMAMRQVTAANGDTLRISSQLNAA